jgi:hypothetical protein
VAQPGVNGGTMVWLCGSASLPGPVGTPSCPAGPGTIAGRISADQVVGPAAQGISPGEFEEVARAFRNGVAYANVHTTQHPAGEIHGQLRREWGNPAADSSANGGAGSATAADGLDEEAMTAWLREAGGRTM